jgi:hypothetical protein
MTIPTILDPTNIYLVRHLNIRRRGAPKLLKTRFLWWPGLRSALLTVSNNGVADKSPAIETNTVYNPLPRLTRAPLKDHVKGKPLWRNHK